MSSNAEIGPVVFVLNSTTATRQSLEALLGASGWRTEAYATAHEFLNAPVTKIPTCLVLDAALVDMCGLELQKRLADSRPHLAIVFVALRADVAAGVRAIKSGAVDFLTTPLDESEILRAVDGAIKCSGAALERDAELRVLDNHYASLSGREREVMALVTAGLLNKQVGGRLGISEITVKAHRGQVMRKMNARSFADLVHKAASLGLEMSPPRDCRLPGSVTTGVARTAQEAVSPSSAPVPWKGFASHADWPARHRHEGIRTGR